MGEPAMTSAANVEEGNEVQIGGRWVVVEGTESLADDEITFWFDEGAFRTFAIDDQLAVCK